MKLLLRCTAPLALGLAISACSVSSMLGGGGKPPLTLLTLTPDAPAPATLVRAANAAEAVTIATPVIAKELRTTRVPAQVGPSDVQYIKGLVWVDTPDRLFKDLLAETLRRTTGRVVLDSRQSGLDPGLVVSGQLQRFGYDVAARSVIVQYDGALSTQGGTRVETRRFEARVPADGTALTVGPALNSAASQVAREVAGWIGG
jgi:cholesterol transport system auxiliary component